MKDNDKTLFFLVSPRWPRCKYLQVEKYENNVLLAILYVIVIYIYKSVHAYIIFQLRLFNISSKQLGNLVFKQYFGKDIICPIFTCPYCTRPTSINHTRQTYIVYRFVETPREFIIAKLLIFSLVSSEVSN